MSYKRLSLLAVILAVASFLSGCGGSSKSPSVAVTASVTTVDATDTVALTATVTNDKGTDGVAWSVSGGGTLSNTTTTSATYTAPAATSTAQTVTVTATSVADSSKTASVTLTVPAAPAITTTDTQLTGAVGTAYSVQLAGSGGIAPYTWKLTTGTLPTGWTLTTAGLLSGPAPTAAQAGVFYLTFGMTDSGTPTALTASMTRAVVIYPAANINFTGTVPATATYNVAYSGSAAATGGVGALTYSLASGALPTGLTLSPTSGAITGTPTAAGTFNFGVTAADGFGDSVTQSYQIVVSYPALKVTAATLPTGYAGSAYAQTTLAATGGSGAGYSFALASGSSLPAGLSLSAAGAITGKPTAQGTTNFTVTVTDSASNTANGTFSITVNAELTVTPATPPVGYVGSQYTQTTLAATGGSGTGYTWSLANGSNLPAGLTLSTGGVISGKPTGTLGTTNFTAAVTDSVGNTASGAFAITVNAGVSITTGTTLPTGYVGASYSQTLAATGGSGTGYSWAVASGSTLPAGLTLSAAGLLSGKPTTAGTPSFTITVTDSAQNTASATFAIAISNALAITSPSTLPTAYVGLKYSQTLTAAGGSGTGYTWALASGETLPPGFTFTAAGVFSGTPTTPNDTSIQVTVTDSTGNTATSILGVIIDAGVAITTGSTLPTGYVGSNYSQTLTATGGSGTGYSWTVASDSNLPGGLSLTAAGLLSGKPTTVSNPNFSVTVTDSVGNTITGTLSMAILPAVSINSITLPVGYPGTVYTPTTLTATGGSGTGYSWTWAAASGSTLPAGLTLSTAGAITGNPANSGTASVVSSVVVTVTDSVGNTASTTLSVTIEASLTISTSATLPGGVVGAVYSQPLQATGGTGSYTWSLVSGGTQLAGLGLTFNPDTASVTSSSAILGGPVSFTVQVSDNASPAHTVQATFTVTVSSYSIITTTLSPNYVYTGSSYSATINTLGGTSPYTWTVSSGGSALTAAGLSLSTGTGLSNTISGNVASGATTSPINFTVKVVDANGISATQAYSLTVYGGLSLTTPSTTVPGPAVIGQPYTGNNIFASGGNGSYSWAVTGLTSALGYNNTGNPLVISGTPPTTSQTINASVTLTDTTTGKTYGPITYTIAVNPQTSLSLPTTNPGSLPATALIDQAYYGSVSVTGGVAPYNWNVNFTTDSDGLYWNTGTDGSSLIIRGTPLNVTTAGNPVTFKATVYDSTGASFGPETYTITFNPLITGDYPVYGNISFNGCGYGNEPPITLTLTSTDGHGITQTAISDSTGTYYFSNDVPNGSYTITPSMTGPATSIFSPTSLPVTVNGSYVLLNNFNAYVGYTVSGTVGYSGAKSGVVYLAMNSCGSPAPGTAILAPGAFTIQGVPPGVYTVNAWMDNLGYGAQNISNPLGSTSNVVVPNTNNANVTIGLTDPDPATLSSASQIVSANGFADGAVLTYSPVYHKNSAGTAVEMASSYTVQWSATQDFSSVAGSASFPASGWAPGYWVLNTTSVTGLTQGGAYYFRVQGGAGSSTSSWSSVAGPVTISAPSTTNTVSGQITFSQTAKGPLYVGYLNQNTNQIYLTQVGSAAVPPTSPASYSLQVPSGNNYFFFALLDQNNDGMVDSGDITNVDGYNMIVPAVAISGAASENLTLSSGNSLAVVRTQNGYFSSEWGIQQWYDLFYDVTPVGKLPIAVELTSAPAGSNIVTPADIAWCFSCGSEDKFSAFNPSYNIGTTAPTVGPSYGVKVSYPDGTSDTAAPQVTGVVSNMAANLSPAGPLSAINNSPNFTWSYPASAGNYLYQFWLGDSNWNTLWSIPNYYSSSNDFTSALSPSLTLAGGDPTDPINTPTISTLSTGAVYYWDVQAFDAHGNFSTYIMYYVSGYTALALPNPNPSSLGSATIGQSYSGSITASGGYGGYSYSVNAENNMGYTNVSIGNGLYATSNNGTLTISGTPNATGTVSFTVYADDTTGTQVGPVTYTININNYAPVSLPAASSNPLGSALVSTPYAVTINASGGSGNYSFTVNGTTVPTSMTYVSIASGGDGLTVANSGGNTLWFAGTPSAVESVSLDVVVTDTSNTSDTASVTYTLPVINGPDGAHNSYLNGRYVCKIDGFNDSDGARWTSLASFQANGAAATITGGVYDMNGRDQSSGSASTGTMTGTYSIGADNNGLVTMNSVQTVGGTGSKSSQFAIALNNLAGPTASEFRMVESDDVGASPSGMHSTGDCYLATPSAFAAGTISGHSFAFGFQGEDGNGVPRAKVGRFSASGGNITSGIVDGMSVDQTGDNGGAFIGSYTTPNTTTGRVTLTIIPSGGFSVDFVAYIIDANRMFLLETAGDSGVQAGDMRTQLQTSYSAANLSGPIVMYAQGYRMDNGSPSRHDSQVSQVTGNGAGGLTLGQSYMDDNGTYKVGNAGGTVTLTFDSTYAGRVTFPGDTGHTSYLYFYDNSSALYMDLGSSGYLQTGWVEPQTQTTFTDAALAGNYLFGQLQPMQATQHGNVGELNVSSGGAITGGLTEAGQGDFSYDQSQNMGTLSWDSTAPGTGTFLIGSGDKGVSCAVISATKTVCTLNADSDPSVLILQQ
jgi:hypothetical protein